MAATTASKPEQAQANPPQERLPPPFLFQGPPSLNTSNLSLPPGLLPGSHNHNHNHNSSPSVTAKPTSATSAALHHHQPSLPGQYSARSTPPDLTAATTATPANNHNPTPAPGSTSGSPFMRSSRLPAQGQGHGLGYGLGYGTGTGTARGMGLGNGQGHGHTHGDMDGSAGGADALWQQMQNTLAEVELSAMNGDHVFGTQHARALEELRDKQLALALAWARSEADEVVENPPAEEGASTTATTAGAGATTTKGGGGTGAGAANGGGGGGGGGAGGGAESTRKNSTSTATDEGIQPKFMGEKTERDILLARKRREANDRYFDRVNSGVLDVVAKLEEAALAMRVVERESKEVWNESSDDDNDGSVDVDGPSSAVGSAVGSVAASTTTSRHHRSTIPD
ncbi:hypothetical protein EMCG_05652 [[Emmonsia] crescens]|uniref:Uncharacterized protein n=1 Tax=[Emmonsia] crescens TaxID=73230 RepID=A0A0G2IDU5_9EURO|nr:hypothetical protein EMCG_05652 [Emmonsia crescens UAMH 3008]